MDLCLDPASKLVMAEQRVGRDFKLPAKHRKSLCTFTIGCLHLSRLTPRLRMCLGFYLHYE